MGPPSKQPWFFNYMSGKEFTFPDTKEEAEYLVQQIAWIAETFPLWHLDSGAAGPIPVQVAVVTDDGGKLTVLRFSAANVEGTLRAVVDASGWVRVTAEVGGRQVFEAYTDSPYEEHPLWPAGASPAPEEEEPGVASKHLWSMSLRVSAWPELAAIATGGVVNLEVPDR